MGKKHGHHLKLDFPRCPITQWSHDLHQSNKLGATATHILVNYTFHRIAGLTSNSYLRITLSRKRRNTSTYGVNCTVLSRSRKYTSIPASKQRTHFSPAMVYAVAVHQVAGSGAGAAETGHAVSSFHRAAVVATRQH